ncbi:MAG: elongation factor Ts, partial [Atopobiaceae bacterium]|nr:elongation factor Ts [Atopobiaceae bacterium]
EDVPADVVAHEFEIAKAQAAQSGKPEAIQERMANGKLEKYYKENVLAEQAFVKDSSVNVSQLAKKVSKELGDNIELVSFVRYNFGE